ncbi:uncharacterized protein N7498_003103 [Penicillium cinerascens]|uniref:DUF7703 domain-containing protein n=1 Tax=Penicillium cinerascens TaxID=70096 RepID=A0A9W9T6L3_9EURO|nr:uncharacterized protein N7498_003103 [Penicillium cinerascens]KAJ5211457.1 hypothetical protein N7498_003103 [Penicillium cinerascens]
MSPSASNAAAALMHQYSTGDVVPSQVLAAFAAIAWYNSIELVVLYFVSFKRRRGCYFWSLLISSVGIIPLCLGYVLLFFPTGVTPYFCVTLIILGWCTMVTGQSVVLWSRLHLVLQNTKVLWGVLWMIIIDALLFHVPTTVLLYGAVAEPDSNWLNGYNIMERIQLVGFCIQELIISGIYVWETTTLLHLRPHGRPQGILNQLLVINIIILVLDVAVVVIEFVGYYSIQVMFKPVAYSIKLKLEYAILGKMVAIARGGYNHDEVPPNARETTSLPSSRRHLHGQYSPPGIWDSSQQSISASSAIV